MFLLAVGCVAIFAHLANGLSDNVQEDATLNAPQLIHKYGYPVEVHDVTTRDGYIVQMHRIPYGISNSNSAAKPIVFIMHGIFSSSADWVIMGPGSGLGYILADEGFDVWMGNARGNYYSRRHTSLDPRHIDFWNFSWHEIGIYDLPAMIDYILNNTGASKIHYIGHSQGTTSFFVMTSTRPEYNDKIILMQALAPVAYFGNTPHPFYRFLAGISTEIDLVSSIFGLGELLPTDKVMSITRPFCEKGSVTVILCSNLFFLLGGFNENQFNKTLHSWLLESLTGKRNQLKISAAFTRQMCTLCGVDSFLLTMLPVILSHTPAGASVRQVVHYGQLVVSGKFRQYDHGFKNVNKYGSITPPNYALGQVKAPVMLHYSDSDPLSDTRDVNHLFRKLGGQKWLIKVPQKTFSHHDYLWGINARELVYDRVINAIKST